MPAKKRGKKNISRRDFLKYSGRVGVGATVGGIIGNVFGRGYDVVKSLYIDNVDPYVDKVSEFIDKANDGVSGIIDKYNPFSYGKKEPEKKEPERDIISRRTLLTTPFRILHRYPVATGTTAGAVAGGVRSVVKGRQSYVQERRHYDLTESVQRLEEALEEMNGKLEEILNKPGTKMIAIGITGFLTSLVFGSLDLTGFSIAENPTFQTNWINVLVLLVFLIVLFVGVSKRKPED